MILRTKLSLALLIGLSLAAFAIPNSPAAADPAPTVTVAAVGDMACDTSNPKFAGGVGTVYGCAQQTVSDRLLADTSVTAVLGLGDYQYDCGDLADYAVSYNPTWGRLDAIMQPIVGNHEYKTGNDVYGAPCPSTNATATNYFAHFGAAAHPETQGHFSFDLGAWHLIALNANCAKAYVGGCGAKSPQTGWLRADLAATTQPCILAFWHQPLYQGIAKGVVPAYKPWWDALLAAQADVVLNGHIHNYQRYPAMDSASYPTAAGLTEYVVGTGGEAMVLVAASTSPTPAYWRKDFGYMRLALSDGGWHSVFVSRTGYEYDAYDGVCH